MVLIMLFKFIKILLLLNYVHICFFKFSAIEFGTENRYLKSYCNNAFLLFSLSAIYYAFITLYNLIVQEVEQLFP